MAGNSEKQCNYGCKIKFLAVFTRRVDSLQAGECSLPDFEIEVGGMDYGFEINGIPGMDFLLQAGAIINLRDMKIGFAD